MKAKIKINRLDPYIRKAESFAENIVPYTRAPRNLSFKEIAAATLLTGALATLDTGYYRSEMLNSTVYRVADDALMTLHPTKKAVYAPPIERRGGIEGKIEGKIEGRIEDGYSYEQSQFLEDSIQAQRARIEGTGKNRSLVQPMKIVEIYEGNIKKAATKYSVPGYIALGLAVLENGGDINSSTFCCTGVMQLSKAVAQKYGAMGCTGTQTGEDCKNGRWIDLRGDPEKNIDAGMHYLSDLYQRFNNDWGFAIQAYHSGPTNVQKSVSRFMRAAQRKDVDWRGVDRAFLEKEKIKWSDVMMERAGFSFFAALNDDAANYLPKAIACYRLYFESR